MTAKEKANELIERFSQFEVSVLYVDFENETCIATNTMVRRSAIKCAIIAVEEIIAFCNGCTILNKGKDTDNIWGYWQEVLSELNQSK